MTNFIFIYTQFHIVLLVMNDNILYTLFFNSFFNKSFLFCFFLPHSIFLSLLCFLNKNESNHRLYLTLTIVKYLTRTIIA